MRNEKWLSDIAKRFLVSGCSKLGYTSETINKYNTALSMFYKKRKNNNEELYQIDIDEIKKIFNEKAKEVEETSLREYISGYNAFFKWIETDENNKDIICRYTYEEYTNYLNQYVEEGEYINSFLSRNDIYMKAATLFETEKYRNIEIGAILISAFEGIVIDKCELNDLKYTDLSGNILKISNKNNISRSIVIPNDYKKLISNSYRKSKNEYIIDNQKGKREKVHSRANRMIDEYCREKINNATEYKLKVVKNSGRCFYLSLIEQTINSELTLEKHKEFYKYVNRRYDYSVEDSALKKLSNLYKNYKLDKKCIKINTLEFTDIYMNIMGIEDDTSDEDKLKVDKDLGNAGEKYIENLLINKYGNDKVIDETKYGQGYDYSVTTDMKMMYEVKSTKQKEYDELIFCMTIKEIKMAYEHKDKFKLCIVYFKDDDSKHLYVIDNPLSSFGFIKDKAERIVDMDFDKCGFMPLEVKMRVPFDKIIIGKDNNL